VIQADLVYAKVGGTPLRLDLYTPSGSEAGDEEAVIAAALYDWLLDCVTYAWIRSETTLDRRAC
jgi:hypothetical protein